MEGNSRSQMPVPQTALEGASSGSQTVTSTQASDGENRAVTLRLRAPRQTDSRRIRWAEDVVDNEGMGKKSSKVCCIYHKPGEDGDSDSEDSSSSSEDDDEPDLSRAQRAGGGKGGKGRRKNSDGTAGKGSQRRPSPNAYERQPKHKHTQGG